MKKYTYTPTNHLEYKLNQFRGKEEPLIPIYVMEMIYFVVHCTDSMCKGKILPNT